MIIVTIVLKVLILLLCVLLTLFIVLMIIPFEYSLNLKISEDIDFQTKILWMFQMIKISFLKEKSNLKIDFFLINKKVFSIRPTQKFKQKKKEKKYKKESNKGNKSFFKQNFINYAISYFKDILKIVRPKKVEIKGGYGFYDPSITGFLSGFIPILEQIIPSSDIKLQPVFDNEIIDVKVTLWGKMILFFIAHRTIKFILKKEVRKTLFKKPKTIET